MIQILRKISILMIGLIIFIGLTVLAYGGFQWQLFIQHRARIAYLVIIFILQLFAVFYMSSIPKKTSDSRKNKEFKFDLILIQIFSLSIVFIGPLTDYLQLVTLPFSSWGRYLGNILLIPGFLIMQTAEKQLQKQFSIKIELQDDHQLITTGIYRWIRHPRYLGICIFFTGISLIFLSAISLLITALLSGVLLWRISKEETLMATHFGDTWQRYQTHSWRIIPFVY